MSLAVIYLWHVPIIQRSQGCRRAGRQRGIWGTIDGSTEVQWFRGNEFLGQVESVAPEVCGHLGSREM